MLRFVFALTLALALSAVAMADPTILNARAVTTDTANNVRSVGGNYFDLRHAGIGTAGSTTRGIVRVSLRTDASNVDQVHIVSATTSTSLSTVGTTRSTTGILLEDGQTAYFETTKRYILCKLATGSTSATVDIVRIQ